MNTVSLCNVCYKRIPAMITYTDDGVWMHKVCDEHGTQYAQVEADTAFYHTARMNNCRIYNGHFVDITGVCQLNCKYCYHKKDTSHKTKSQVIEELAANGPYFLIGGEPTIHPRFIDIVDEVSKYGDVGVVTNFIAFMDKSYLLRSFRRLNPIHSAVSYHIESGLSMDTIADTLLSTDICVHSLIAVVDTIEQLAECVDKMLSLSQGAFMSFRLKLASKVWNTTNDSGLYASQALRWFKEKFGCIEISPTYRYDYVELMAGNRLWSLVKWPTVHNVDIMHQQCGPTAIANDGSCNNVILSYLLNEKPC